MKERRMEKSAYAAKPLSISNDFETQKQEINTTLVVFNKQHPECQKVLPFSAL